MMVLWEYKFADNEGLADTQAALPGCDQPYVWDETGRLCTTMPPAMVQHHLRETGYNPAVIADARTIVATRETVLARLRALHDRKDWDRSHREADMLLLALIGDDEVSAAFEALTRWYS